MPGRRKRISATSELVGRQIEAARERLQPRVSQTQLSLRLRDLGVELDQSAVARLEAGDRLVTVDELFAIAAALGVSPLYLLSGDLTNEDVPVTPGVERTPSGMRFWLRGELPLNESDAETFFELVPNEERLLREWRSADAIRRVLADDLRAAVERKDLPAMRDAAIDIAREAKWLQKEIEQEQERAQRARKED
jgi:transcriptional regulator with XRE-family HTH domain